MGSEAANEAKFDSMMRKILCIRNNFQSFINPLVSYKDNGCHMRRLFPAEFCFALHTEQ